MTPCIPAMSDTYQLAAVLGLPSAELVRRRRAGIGPRAVKVGREWVYLRAHVLEWLAEVTASAAVDARVVAATGSN